MPWRVEFNFVALKVRATEKAHTPGVDWELFIGRLRINCHAPWPKSTEQCPIKPKIRGSQNIQLSTRGRRKSEGLHLPACSFLCLLVFFRTCFQCSAEYFRVGCSSERRCVFFGTSRRNVFCFIQNKNGRFLSCFPLIWKFFSGPKLGRYIDALGARNCVFDGSLIYPIRAAL